MNIKLGQFQKELLDNPTSFICSKYILDRIPHIFNNDRIKYIKWKEDLGSRLGIDSKAISFTGSSCTGFSLNPSKSFKKFDFNSDIDIAIVSNLYFDIAWNTLRNLGTKQLTLSAKQKISLYDHKNRLIYWGTIATDKILELLPFGIDWSFILLEMSTSTPVNGKTINIRLYKDYESLRAYHVSNLTNLRTQLFAKSQIL